LALGFTHPPSVHIESESLGKEQDSGEQDSDKHTLQPSHADEKLNIRQYRTREGRYIEAFYHFSLVAFHTMAR
jgi:hypothetical protein